MTGRFRTAIAAAFCVASLALGQEGRAQDRVNLGWGRAFSNDAFGDRKDRWRTGSYTLSILRGPSWQGSLPPDFGELLEFRTRAEIIAPANLTTPSPGDRRYAGVLSLGLHTHFDLDGLETSLGLDLVLTGPQTGLFHLQEDLHRILSLPQPLAAANQLPNDIHPTFVAEIGQSFPFGTNGTFRPFVEAQMGIETFVRAGFDLSVGHFGDGALMLREQVTGQRYRGIAGDRKPGVTFTLGGDVAHVFNSALLPSSGAARLNDTRIRLRAGLGWQGKRAAVFYGLTWLGKEFEGQPEGQLVGTISLRLVF